MAGQWDASGYLNFDSSTKILNLFGLHTAPEGGVGIFTMSKHISMVKPRNFIAEFVSLCHSVVLRGETFSPFSFRD